ncbi:MAG: DUF1592 domain-containing protein [Vicinamibacterales bacterium]|jgi:hypothetical protein|nr:DUF1592 domain-containing protein [Vicinamibacterales bacterium]
MAQTSRHRVLLTTVAAALACAVWGASVQAQERVESADIAPLVEEHCYRCHGPETQSAGINLSTLVTERPLVKQRDTWNRVVGMLEMKRMPPQGALQLSESVRTEMLAILSREIDDFDYSTIDDPGFERMRRLTHTEFDNTVRDLFGVDLNPTDRFPDELTGSSGFENSSNTLFLQPSLMERYIAVAERIVNLALPETPTTETPRRTRELIFTARPGRDSSETDVAEMVLRRFLTRAYRRPPTTDEMTQAVDQYGAGRTSGLGHEGAVKQVLQSALISPKFLLRVEAGRDGNAPFPVSDWELASRLSYFLWSSMPDQELLDLASRGVLREPETLRGQVDRMLADEKANTLGTVFAAQWLGFQHVGTRIWLDPIDNPWCTATLMTAMRDESSLFFLSLLRDNQPIGHLVDADYTYVNEELATTLYGMEGVRGDHMRRVRLDDPNRGGLIGQASILALTSNYKDTSPVKRGHYILDTLLGTPPPPPPPNVGVLSEEVADMRELSFREKVEMHSENPTCRVCHSKIDPIGFGLENFDYFGRWRDTYDFRQRVETADEADEVREFQTETSPEPITRYYKTTRRVIPSAGALPDGTAFSGPAGLKQALLDSRHDDLVRQVVSKMLAYALGRQLDYYDEPAVRAIIARLEAAEYRFQTLLQAIVESYPFQYKKNPAEETN